MTDDGDGEAIILERVNGKSVRDIARERGMTQAAIEAIIDRAAEEALSARALRRLLHVEACRLEAIKSVLFEKAMAGENAAAAIYIKASERLSSMIGINSPQGHYVTISSTIEPAEQPSNTVRMLEAIRRLKGEAEKPDDEESPPGGDKLN
jgi:hypothetical protein